MKNSFREEMRRWMGRPLCCKYKFVHFSTQLIGARVGVGGRGQSVIWALGMLGGSGAEVLGVWEGVRGQAADWQSIFDELSARGVESVRFVSGVDDPTACNALPWTAAVSQLRPELSDLEQAATILSASMQRAAHAAADRCRSLEQSMHRSVGRTQRLDSDFSATRTVSTALFRLARKSEVCLPHSATSLGSRGARHHPAIPGSEQR